MLRDIRLPFFLLLLFLLTACGGDQTETGDTDPPAGTEPAIAELSAEISAQPRKAELYAQRARLYFDGGGYDEAISDLTIALQIDSANLGYHHALADVYLKYFRSRLALRTLERAHQLDPADIETLLRLSEVQLTLKQYDDALASADQAIGLNGRNPEAFFLLGRIMKEQGDTSRAINSFQEAVELDPELTDAWINLGMLHAAVDGKRALEFYDAAIASDRYDVLPVHAKADYLRDRDDLNGAIALYRETTRMDRQYSAGYFNAGLLLMEQDSVESAYREFDITLKNDPLHVRAYFFRGYAAELLGRTDQARADYKSALKMAPDYALPQEGMARLGDGN